MVISPAVPAPKSGDPITAKWAADLAAAVNSCANPADRVGEVSTPYGKASPAPGIPMLGAATMPQPFDCTIFRNANGDDLYIWLPSFGAEYVVYNGAPLENASTQSVGTATTGWVKVGSVSHGGTKFIYLKLHTDYNGDVDGWEIESTSTKWNPASGGTGTGNELPRVLLATYNIASDSTVPQPGTDNKFPSGKSGLVQCRHGSVSLDPADVETALDTDATPGSGSYVPGESIDRWESSATPPPDPAVALELRKFYDTTDVEPTKGIGETGGDTAPDSLQTLFRKTGGTGSARPKLVYVEAATGPFWVKGADASQNFGASIKLGSSAIGYVTISVTQ